MLEKGRQSVVHTRKQSQVSLIISLHFSHVTGEYFTFAMTVPFSLLLSLFLDLYGMGEGCYTKYRIWCHQFYFVLLHNNWKSQACVVSPTLNANQTPLLIPCKKQMGIMNFQCCNHCRLLSDFACKFQLFMTIFHY